MKKQIEKRRFTAVLRKFGQYSFGFTVPKEVIEHFGLGEGDHIQADLWPVDIEVRPRAAEEVKANE